MFLFSTVIAFDIHCLFIRGGGACSLPGMWASLGKRFFRWFKWHLQWYSHGTSSCTFNTCNDTTAIVLIIFLYGYTPGCIPGPHFQESIDLLLGPTWESVAMPPWTPTPVPVPAWPLPWAECWQYPVFLGIILSSRPLPPATSLPSPNWTSPWQIAEAHILTSTAPDGSTKVLSGWCLLFLVLVVGF